MGPIGLQDDPHLTMSPAERRAAFKARRERLFQRNLEAEIKMEAEIKIGQIIETPLTQSPAEQIQVNAPIDGFQEWLAHWRGKPLEDAYVPKCPDVKTIQRVVCRQFKISVIDVLSPRRTADVVRPRQIAMYLCKNITMKSLPDIGRRFGGRDHTTVLHAVRKIDGLISRDAKVAAIIDELKQQLSVD